MNEKGRTVSVGSGDLLGRSDFARILHVPWLWRWKSGYLDFELAHNTYDLPVAAAMNSPLALILHRTGHRGIIFKFDYRMKTRTLRSILTETKAGNFADHAKLSKKFFYHGQTAGLVDAVLQCESDVVVDHDFFFA